MKEFVQIDESTFVQATSVIAVRKVEGKEDACVIYLKGQVPLEGFPVNASAESVVADLEEDVDEE